VLGLDADGARDVVHGGLMAAVAAELADDALDAQRELLEVARRPDGPRVVAEVALELAVDRRDGVARECDPAGGVEAVDGLDEAVAGDLETSSKGSSGRW